ncbi:DDE-type integrase/transposase/recombinase, partial [Parasphingorhabdus sp.]|uniref:DDE-type integrase/transposase/recombinase n=1 Tax=Parasphingorhabdus sp. TaxID=2709688 RepID=UPI003299A3B8
DRKWRNNRIESDHAAMKRLLGYRQSFRSLRTAKATLSGIETIRTIKRHSAPQLLRCRGLRFEGVRKWSWVYPF